MPLTTATPDLLRWLDNCTDARRSFGDTRYWQWMTHIRDILREQGLKDTPENRNKIVYEASERTRKMSAV